MTTTAVLAARYRWATADLAADITTQHQLDVRTARAALDSLAIAAEDLPRTIAALADLLAAEADAGRVTLDHLQHRPETGPVTVDVTRGHLARAARAAQVLCEELLLAAGRAAVLTSTSEETRP